MTAEVRMFTSLLQKGSLTLHQPPVKYWEIVADKLSSACWSWGYCSAVTENCWRWIVDAHEGDGKRYIVHSGELLSAFLALEATLL